MAEDSDADLVRRERERRRGEERARMERDRREREMELARLRRSELLNTVDEAERDSGRHTPPPFETGEPALVAPPPEAPRPAPRPARRAPPAPVHEGAAPSAPRSIGRAIHSSALQQLLSIDPTEKFDMILLNALRFPGVAEEAANDPRILESLRDRTQTLMSRVKAEEDDPLSAGAFLREQVLTWYRASPTDPEWTYRMPHRWAGLFADSRVLGGKLYPWLNHRLMALYESTVKRGRLGSRIRSGLSRSKPVDTAVTRSAVQLIQAQAAQAILDDIAVAPRDGDKPFPLVRLSELAMRREVQTVNDALSLLFGGHESGPFIVLHPNRYPDCGEIQIRPPAPGATGAALAFLLANPKMGRKGARGAGGAPGEASESGEGVEGGSIWESQSVTADAWKAQVEEARQERKRLESPPKDYRVRPAYPALKDLLLDDAEFRKAFLAAKWRGRPAGIPLLVTLLQKGSYTPEVQTDFEYLEAELGVVMADDPEFHPKDGKWTFRNWTVTREAGAGGAAKYTAERTAEPAESSESPPPPPPPA